MKQRFRILVWALGLGVIAYLAPIDYTGSDSRGALLTSQSILEGNLGVLDSYEGQVEALGARVYESSEGWIYFFPIGSSLLALPGVAVTRVVGNDMARNRDDTRLQMVLSSLTISALVLLFWIPLRRIGWVGELCAVLLVAASPLMSTIGTAYWNVASATFCIVAAAILLVHSPKRGRQPAVILATLLIFLAWLCRPTMAIPGLILLAYVLVYRKEDRWLLVASTLAGALLTAWILTLLQGSVLPPYYRPSRVTGAVSFSALAGLMISPSRGLLLYCPQLLIIGLIATASLTKGRNWLIVGASAMWFFGHWIAVSRFEHWWGGHSYGPRLMLEAYLAMALMVCLLDHFAIARRRRRALVIALVATLLLGSWIHVTRGLYEKGTAYWNHYPENIDRSPSRLWDWGDAQLLASQDGISRKWFDERSAGLQTTSLDQATAVNTPQLALRGFRHPGKHEGRAYSWGFSRQLHVELQLDTEELRPHLERDIAVVLEVGAYREQELVVRWRDQELAMEEFRGFDPRRIAIQLPVAALMEEGASPVGRVKLELATRPLFRRNVLVPQWRDPRLTVSLWTLETRVIP